MSLQITGKLLLKGETQQVSERFKKREFVLELSEDVANNTYINYAKMQMVQNKCDILDRFNEGDNVTVDFNIKGNKWEKDGKVNFITNLDAWRIATAGANTGQPAMQSTAAQPSANNGGAAFYTPSPENVDDLPF